MPGPRDAAVAVEYAPVAEGVLAEATRVLRTVDPASTGALLGVLPAGRRVVVTGEGRSGLVGRRVAMRLVHTGRVASSGRGYGMTETTVATHRVPAQLAGPMPDPVGLPLPNTACRILEVL